MPKRIRDTAGTTSSNEWAQAEALAEALAADVELEPELPDEPAPEPTDEEVTRELRSLMAPAVEPEPEPELPGVTAAAAAEAAQAIAAARPSALDISAKPQKLSESNGDILERVQKAARARKRYSKQVDAATRELQVAVVEAREAGGSLREIAKVAGVSYDTIDRWTKS